MVVLMRWWRWKGTHSELKSPQNEWQIEQNHQNLLNFQAFGGRALPDPRLGWTNEQTDKCLQHIYLREQNKQGGPMFTGCLWRSQMGCFFIWQPPVKQLPRQVSGRRGSTDNWMPAPTVFHKAQLMWGGEKKEREKKAWCNNPSHLSQWLSNAGAGKNRNFSWDERISEMESRYLCGFFWITLTEHMIIWWSNFFYFSLLLRYKTAGMLKWDHLALLLFWGHINPTVIAVGDSNTTGSRSLCVT